MIVEVIIGNLADRASSTKRIDYIHIEWYESTKRIQRLRSEEGIEVAIRFFQQEQKLLDGDIVYEDAEKMIVIQIKSTEIMILKPSTVLELARLSYEIGNKHLSMYYENSQIIMPYERTIYQWFQHMKYNPVKCEGKLSHLFDAQVKINSRRIDKIQLNKTTILNINT